jgi:tetratricopeptide (TPR) repeat protein
MQINSNLKLVARVLIILPVLFLTINTVVVVAFPFRELKEGNPVPDVTLTPLETEKSKVTFSGIKGTPFIVIFWGADLPEKIKHSAQILGDIEKLVPFLDERNIQRYSVNVQNDGNDAVQEVVSKSKSTIEIYKDENLKAYATLGIYVMPVVLLVDQEGNVSAGMGYSHDLIDRLKGSIEIMLGEKTEAQVAAELRPEMIEATAEEKASKRHFSYGMVMMKRGQFDAAIRELSKAVENDPGMSAAYLQLGCLYLGKNEYENAERAINKALDADPESVQGKICQGELLRLRKQLDEAEKLLQEVISSHPENYKAKYNLGRVLEDKKKDKEAMENYKKAYRSIVKYSVRNK